MATTSPNDSPGASENEENKQPQNKYMEPDTKLIVDDGHVMVSRASLCMSSPVFDSMLNLDFKESQNNEVQLPGKSLETVEFIAKYINLREPCPIEDKLLENVLAFSEEYLMERLKKDCMDHMTRLLVAKNCDVATDLYSNVRMGTSDVVRFHQLANRFELSELKSVTTRILRVKGLSELQNSKYFSIETMGDLLISKIKCLENEVYEWKRYAGQLEDSKRDSKCREHKYASGPHCTECGKSWSQSFTSTLRNKPK